jgi:hypothetical protein
MQRRGAAPSRYRSEYDSNITLLSNNIFQGSALQADNWSEDSAESIALPISRIRPSRPTTSSIAACNSELVFVYSETPVPFSDSAPQEKGLSMAPPSDDKSEFFSLFADSTSTLF